MRQTHLRFIEAELAEIVAPDCLVDVLSTLLTSRAILEFQIIGGMVYIEPNPDKRFDLEIIALDFSKQSPLGYPYIDKPKSRKNPADG